LAYIIRSETEKMARRKADSGRFLAINTIGPVNPKWLMEGFLLRFQYIFSVYDFSIESQNKSIIVKKR